MAGTESFAMHLIYASCPDPRFFFKYAEEVLHFLDLLLLELLLVPN